MKRIFFTSLLVTLLVSAAAYFYYTLPDVAELKRRNPKTTALMELREDEYRKKNLRVARQQFWVGYGAISFNTTLPSGATAAPVKLAVTLPGALLIGLP